MTDQNHIEALEGRAYGPPPDMLPDIASVFTHPDDVVRDSRLSVQEKRAILAAWASDARAVAFAPMMRQLESGALVHVDEIMRALQSIDDAAAVGPSKRARSLRLPDARRLFSTWCRRNSSKDDDDDPPPCPAGARRPLRPTLPGGVAAAPDPVAALV